MGARNQCFLNKICLGKNNATLSAFIPLLTEQLIYTSRYDIDMNRNLDISNILIMFTAVDIRTSIETFSTSKDHLWNNIDRICLRYLDVYRYFINTRATVSISIASTISHTSFEFLSISLSMSSDARIIDNVRRQL